MCFNTRKQFQQNHTDLFQDKSSHDSGASGFSCDMKSGWMPDGPISGGISGGGGVGGIGSPCGRKSGWMPVPIAPGGSGIGGMGGRGGGEGRGSGVCGKK